MAMDIKLDPFYVDDLITGLISIMNTDDEFTGPINLGNDIELSILEIANQIIKLTNSNSRIIKIASLPDDPIQRKPDLSLARKVIDWNPTTNLNDGLILTIDYFRGII